MGDWKSLPYGVDLGTTRIRVAFGECNRAGSVRLRAIAARDVPETPELLAIVLEEMLAEIGARERRCVAAIGAPSAALRSVRFPAMTWAERVRAARFEAQRFADWDVEREPSLVRTHPIDRANGAYAVGVTRAAAIDARLVPLRAAGLRPVAVDHDAFALRRLFPSVHAVLDVGAERSRLHLYEPGPQTLVAEAGGATVTRGIASDLAVDQPSAERRKRILGFAGAGVAAREQLVGALAELVTGARTRASVERIALTGNGARLPHLARDLEEATGAFVEFSVPDLLRTGDYPDDVVRVAAPDWTLAAALAGWSVCA